MMITKMIMMITRITKSTMMMTQVNQNNALPSAKSTILFREAPMHRIPENGKFPLYSHPV